ncbi:DUF551 domain-containing protein [Enterobacter roggenkampii]|jgi:hypothetical protein|uniref:DUF551 domain-containing protein n=1 Tax=Enterobacter roggenkampii TaxID=1812935 RepID=UPI0007B3D92C|nr:DUF551 domain-containing protein [Enterobacter roggenkampii]KZQ11207.1 hypothetical protein A3461_10885 [Enterobacter roggenkampii]
MSTISKERLEQLASGNAWVCVQDDEAAELARIALASLEAEPVAYSLIFRNMDGVLNDYVNANTTFSTIEKAQAYGRGGNYVRQNDGSMKWVSDPSLDPVVIPLFTAPPAPVSVPDEDLLHMAASAIEDLLSNKDRYCAGVWADIPAKLRRAAMLQGAEPVQGWIPCSERMPEFYFSVLVTDEHEDMVIALPVCLDAGDKCAFQLSNGDIFIATHWQPLPAAPLQEVT